MDDKRVDDVVAFALLVASRGDHPSDRELGPIHLLKIVYLADQAYAERHEGRTFTRAPWRFHHYGPWNLEVFRRLALAALAIGASKRTFPSEYQNDGERWSVRDHRRVEEELPSLERRLPVEVASAVKAAVRHYGQATSELLHAVYLTPPMLKAAPGDFLDFTPRVEEPPPEVHLHRPTLSAKQEKKRKERLEALRLRVQQKLQQPRSRDLRPLSPPPAYDEGYEEGLRWLDGLAGPPIEDISGEVTFGDDVWTAPGRDDVDVH